MTVIELMVAILIIGLISTIGLISVKDSRAKSRDAKRIYDINQYAKALNLYDLENKHYPQGTDCGSSCSGRLGWNETVAPNTVIKKYIPDLPVDPKDNGSNQYFYYYNENNPNCNNRPTVSVNTTETGKREYNFNPCAGDSANYLIVIQ